VRRYLFPLAVFLSVLITPQLPAQGLPSREAALERMIVVVPMIGNGSPDHPRHPLGMDLIDSLQDAPVGYRYVLSDDGHFAIMLLTGSSTKHFDPLLNAFGAQAQQTFDPKHHDRTTVERVLKLIRRDFNLDAFLSGYRWQGVKP
jgi:hypothetical protein